MKIETNELMIRNFEPTDEQDLCEYMMQRVCAEFEAYPDFTPQKAKEEIACRCASDEFFAIELKEKRKVIGNIYLGKRDFNARELGYVLHEDYQGKGYGSAACAAMIPYVFQRGVHRIYAQCAPQNTASWRLLEKLGFTREAHLKQNVSFHTDSNGVPIYWDTYIYAACNPNAEDERRTNPNLSQGL